MDCPLSSVVADGPPGRPPVLRHCWRDLSSMRVCGDRESAVSHATRCTLCTSQQDCGFAGALARPRCCRGLLVHVLPSSGFCLAWAGRGRGRLHHGGELDGQEARHRQLLGVGRFRIHALGLERSSCCLACLPVSCETAAELLPPNRTRPPCDAAAKGIPTSAHCTTHSLRLARCDGWRIRSSQAIKHILPARA